MEDQQHGGKRKQGSRTRRATFDHFTVVDQKEGSVCERWQQKDLSQDSSSNGKHPIFCKEAGKINIHRWLHENTHIVRMQSNKSDSTSSSTAPSILGGRSSFTCSSKTNVKTKSAVIQIPVVRPHSESTSRDSKMPANVPSTSKLANSDEKRTWWDGDFMFPYIKPGIDHPRADEDFANHQQKSSSRDKKRRQTPPVPSIIVVHHSESATNLRVFTD